MGVQFLSEEWAKAVTDALNSDEGFKKAAGTQSAKVQTVVTKDGEESKYYLKLENGEAEVALGEIDNPDATLSQDYETAAALWRNELSGTAAYMSGKLKLQGDLMKVMQLQGVQSAGQAVVSQIDVDY